MESENTVIVAVKLSASLLESIDKVRLEWGILSRGDFIERILYEVMAPDESNIQSRKPSSPKDL